MLEVLTPSEIELAEKLIGRLEKWARVWVWKRWVMLILGIVVGGLALGGAVYLHALSRKLYLSELYPPYVVTDERPDTDVAHLVDVKLLAIQMRSRMMLGDMLMPHYVSIVVMGGGGAILIVMALVKWRRHLHLGLIAKLLRAKLETERGALPGGALGNTET